MARDSGSQLQGLVAAWAAEHFPDETPESVLAHLREEIDELEAEMRAFAALADRDNADIEKAQDVLDRLRLEAADVLILLTRIGHHYSFDLITAGHEKHRINTTRRWSPASSSRT